MSVYRADAPGRVNLIGEHTDYNDGLVFPTATPQRTAVELRPRDDDAVRIESVGFGRLDYRLGGERRAGDWGDYARGVTWALGESDHPIRGFEAGIASRLPVGAGLASSAALEVALLRALRDAFALDLDDLALARLAHRAESDFVGARVGTMDQLAASLGRGGEALFIDTRSLAIERVPMPARAAIIVVDSGIAHAHAAGEYNRRRSECDTAARLLGLGALRDASLEDAARLARTDPVLARRVRHVVSENERVLEFRAALEAGDLERCGEVLDLSHASLRDDFAVSTAELDVLAELLRTRAGVYGARLVGGGFGGSVLALAEPAQAAVAASEVAQEYRTRTGHAGKVLLPL
jgi:galactokinase